LQSLPTDLARNLLLEQVHNRNEVLYFKVLSEHLPELLPVVYDPTVGAAIEGYSDEYRGQRGVYLSIDRPDEIARSFQTFGWGPDDVDLIVCSDAEEILGIGDWGVGGIQIAIGKLAIYTAGAGVDPSRTIAVSLDVGTDNATLLNDPFYLGNRHARHRGADYDAFIQSYIETAHNLFPNAMLHFEDFGPEHAREILARYSPDYCVFNDDVQGTGAVVMAAVYSGLKIARSPMADQKLVVFGSGTAGVGIADQLRDAMIADGASQEHATSQVWLVDKQGLLFDDMDDLRDFQAPYAKNREKLGVADSERVGLVESIKVASPTILLGTSTVHGAFTRDVIEAMAVSTERPLIFPISNPTEKIEAMPADVLDWSGGKALVATGIRSDPSSTTAPPMRLVRPTTSWSSRAWAWVSSSPARSGSPRACSRTQRKPLQPRPIRAHLVPRCCRMCATYGRCRRWSPRPSMSLPRPTVWRPANPTTWYKPSPTPCGSPAMPKVWTNDNRSRSRSSEHPDRHPRLGHAP
jgi:malate dehydrogenase (oxaloacetate-decarboxylating)